MQKISENSYEFPDRSMAGDLTDFGPSRTQQHLAQECDVNEIVARATRTGILGDPMAINQRLATFQDVADVGDLHTTINKINAANMAFLELPADLRARFSNDPAELLEFLKDPKNMQEAVDLGLAPQSMAPAGKGTPTPAPAQTSPAPAEAPIK